MRLYIMTDMEGVAGIINAEDYLTPGARYHERGLQLSTLGVNAAIDGAVEAGAAEILVVDGHGHGGIDPALLHPAAKLLAGRPVDDAWGCMETFDAAFVIGQHAKSNTDGGHLCHTGSFAIEEMTLNGLSCGELACNLLRCSYFHVPTVLVTGDQACVDEAKVLVPSIEAAVVKWGLRRGVASGLTASQNQLFNGAAVHLSPTRAQQVIRDAARRAVRRRSEIESFWLSPPYELVVTRRHTGDEPPRRAVVRGEDLLHVFAAPQEFVPYRGS